MNLKAVFNVVGILLILLTGILLIPLAVCFLYPQAPDPDHWSPRHAFTLAIGLSGASGWVQKTIANSIFSRMRTERERIAKEYRSEGKEEATKIRAETDKEKVILIAEAYKQEQIIRGDGDGKSTKIYADAFNKDRKFYSFMRSMQAYKNSFQSDTTVLLSEDSDFLEFLNKSR